MNYRQKIGSFGEGLAVGYLKKRGYEIMHRNVKTSYKEIDIIAKKDATLVFVEVKTRTSSRFGLAEESIFHKKTENLKKAINIYLNVINKKEKHKEIRLDLIAVNIDKIKKTAKIKHYKDIA